MSANETFDVSRLARCDYDPIAHLCEEHTAMEAMLERLAELEAADDANEDVMTDDPFLAFVDYARTCAADFRTMIAKREAGA